MLQWDFFAGKIIFYKREKFALIPNNIYICLFIIGLVFVILGFWKFQGLIFVGNVISSISMFTLCVRIDRRQRYKNIFLIFLSKMGNQYSFIIYIIHPIFIHIFSFISSSDSNLIMWIYPFIILVSTILFAVVYDYLKKGFKIVLKKKESA